jgi:hypothetical protein
VIISLVNKAITAITSRLQSLSQFDGTESKVNFYFLLPTGYRTVLLGGEKCSVADPNPDPHVFGPPGSGSESFYHQARTVRKTFIPTAL